ncbi:hypothetical protein TNCV_4951201 [Trichonephila clavipes]|nr:hypothetical protein TNCV_4951201 [Trichonephila clavipes]
MYQRRPVINPYDTPDHDVWCSTGLTLGEMSWFLRKSFKNRRAASPLLKLVKEEERWEAPDHSHGVLPQNWGGNEPNRTLTCMVLKVTANGRRTS